MLNGCVPRRGVSFEAQSLAFTHGQIDARHSHMGAQLGTHIRAAQTYKWRRSGGRGCAGEGAQADTVPKRTERNKSLSASNRVSYAT